MHSTQIERKFVGAETFIEILKNKICKYMTNVCIGKLNSIADKYKIHKEQSKQNLLMLSQVHILSLKLKVMIKILDLKLVTI